jgi:regulator of cell morphogenesis and NO signaling
MDNLDARMPVGRLVAERPARARALERLGIDYCCGGRKSLAEVSAAKGLDVEAVLRVLDAACREAETDDWVPARPAELAEVIVATHHAYLRRELPRLAGLVHKVAAQHGATHPELLELGSVFHAFRACMNSHMNQEEWFIFPLIRRLETAVASDDVPASLAELISAAEHEHDQGGEALARMRALTGGYSPPPDACAAYQALLAGLAELETDMHSHVHKENNILFPEAIAAEAALRAASA